MKTTIGREKKRGRYLLLKITEDTWKLKHVHLWEVAHQRSVPKGHCIKFLDGDVRNFSIDNLQCMTKAEVSKYNIQKISKKKPLGSEKLDRLKKGRYQRTKIKTAEGWKTKHVHLWEQAHKQAVPKGHCIIFLDKNKRNYSIDNLECCSYAETLAINKKRGRSHFQDVTKAHVLLAKIYTSLKKRKKEKGL